MNIEACRATGMNKSCGHGQLLQNRSCTNGTLEKCQTQKLTRTVSCRYAKDPLPPCEKVVTPWKIISSCTASVLNTTCGPGTTKQIRECVDGTIDKCGAIELERFVSCEEAGNPLQDCELKLGKWRNFTSCVPIGDNKSCGPGTVVLEQECIDGTKDLCKHHTIKKTVSCKDAYISLPDCKGNVQIDAYCILQ